MNELYKVLKLYINFFQPTFKLKAKQKRVNQEGKQYLKPYKRCYDKPITPYARVLTRIDIEQSVKKQVN